MKFRPAKKRIEVSVGESVRILRELQEAPFSSAFGLIGACRGSPFDKSYYCSYSNACRSSSI